jgi:ribosomal protein S18 acetylase RimI-like enzyme
MQIERATNSDAEEILALQRVAYRSEAELYGDFNIPPLVEMLEAIKKNFEEQTVLKAVLEGKLVGSVRGFDKEGTCYVGRLIVRPDYQNHGIGTKLMNEIEIVFGESKRFELFTGHRSEKNLHLYEKLGYRTFKTERVHDRLTLVFMEKHRVDIL